MKILLHTTSGENDLVLCSSLVIAIAHILSIRVFSLFLTNVHTLCGRKEREKPKCHVMSNLVGVLHVLARCNTTLVSKQREQFFPKSSYCQQLFMILIHNIFIKLISNNMKASIRLCSIVSIALGTQKYEWSKEDHVHKKLDDQHKDNPILFSSNIS